MNKTFVIFDHKDYDGVAVTENTLDFLKMKSFLKSPSIEQFYINEISRIEYLTQKPVTEKYFELKFWYLDDVHTISFDKLSEIENFLAAINFGLKRYEDQVSYLRVLKDSIIGLILSVGLTWLFWVSTTDPKFDNGGKYGFIKGLIVATSNMLGTSLIFLIGGIATCYAVYVIFKRLKDRPIKVTYA